MKVAIVVLCRYNSSRLPGKILKKIGNKPILQYIIERLQKSKYASGLIVATSSEKSDDDISHFCTKQNIKCFRGPLENVSERFLACGIDSYSDYIVRINGDNLFTDAELMDQLIDTAIEEGHDFVSNVEKRTFPKGISIEVVKLTYYQSIYPQLESEYHKEHVTSYIYENPHLGSIRFIHNNLIKEAHGLNLALDTYKDLEQAEKLINKMKKDHTEYRWQEIVNLLLDEK